VSVFPTEHLFLPLSVLTKRNFDRGGKKAPHWSQEGVSTYKTNKLQITFSGTNFLLCGAAHKTGFFSPIKG